MEMKQINDSQYFISNDGRLFREVAQYEDSNGYMVSHYYAEPNTRHRIKCKIHRLLAQHFISNPHDKPQVNHKDGNKKNNLLNNLEWVSVSENVQHAYDNNLIDKERKRLLNSDTIKIIQDTYVPYDSEFGIRALARKFKVSPSCIKYWTNKRGD